jgi:DNA helicase-2/ATP-dependent DNA helicase PcrA
MPRSTTYVAPRNLKPLPKVSAEVFAPSVSVPEPMPNTDGIEVGCWVEHERFGRGTVLEIENVGGDVKFTINFQNLGEKKILQKYAHLKNLGK